MMCASARELIGPYLDDELDAGTRRAVQDHLADCRDCAEDHARLEKLQMDIRSPEIHFKTPDRLQGNVQRALRHAAASEKHKFGAWPIAIAATALLAVSLAGNLLLFRSRVPRNDVVAESVLASHVRSLIGTHLVDVPSSDQHTVKPWFNGKLDYSPDVKDFPKEGFELAGGRIEYLENRPVAALVYHRRLHVINLFLWPSSPSDSAGEREIDRNGYHMLQWTKDGMTYWAVSDVNEADLRQFENLYGR